MDAVAAVPKLASTAARHATAPGKSLQAEIARRDSYTCRYCGKQVFVWKIRKFYSLVGCGGGQKSISTPVTAGDVDCVWAATKQMGLEGVVAKRLDSTLSCWSQSDVDSPQALEAFHLPGVRLHPDSFGMG